WFIMESRTRFYSCGDVTEITELTSPPNIPNTVDQTRNEAEINQIKNNKPKTNNQRGPTYKTAYKPKPKSLCSQLLRQVTMNKGESMIKARHNYMKKSNKVTSENYVDTEKCHDKIDDITTDRSPKAKKRKTGEVIEGLIWSIEAESAIKEIESLTENSQLSELINCFDTEGAERNKFEKTQEDIRKCTQNMA
ncbi:unnamed protein product, partial [Meganyctiphanes norvegica]